jgi:hypothetical protein
MTGPKWRLSPLDLQKRLVEAARPDGGWSYYLGHASRLESSAWAIMALSATKAPQNDSRFASYSSFVGKVQRADGLLVDVIGPGPNFAWNGLTLLALQALQRSPDAAPYSRLLSALVAVKGIQLAQTDESINRQDNSLQAWPWTEAAFSWVEPTAWCLLAVKKAAIPSPGVAARVREAEALLIDRVCRSGGWNYGNSSAFTHELEPYVPTTALALLALQNKAELPAVQKSLAWLTAHAITEHSAMALGLTAICLQVFKRPVADVLVALAAQGARTNFLDNAHLTALALYALTLPQHGAAEFRV